MFCKNLLYVVLFATHDYVASEMIDLVPSHSPTYLPQNTCMFSEELNKDTICKNQISTNDDEEHRKIEVDSFICSENKEFRFGITTDFYLCLCEDSYKIWCAPERFDSKGEEPYALVSKNGKLVVHSGRVFNRVVWKANQKGLPFRSKEGTLIITNDGSLELQDNSNDSSLIWSADVESYKPYTTNPTSMPSLSLSPTHAPTTLQPTDTLPISFRPGVLETKPLLGIRISEGLTVRVIGQAGKRVQYADGSMSVFPVHGQPDAGGCFDQPDGSFVYVSNSELPDGQGGVGAFTFDKYGNLNNYKMVQRGSSMNCGGGKSPWNTWMSGEEVSGDALTAGGMWEIDPTGQRHPKMTKFGRAKFESGICDDRDFLNLACYATVDSSTGPLRRYKPRTIVLEEAALSGDYSRVLHSIGGSLSYLQLDVPRPGEFSWTRDINAATQNVEVHYPNAEGIDHHEGKLYFVSKAKKMLYVLDLDAKTYVKSSTVSGTFENQPDQISFLIGDHPESDSFLYYLEDGGVSPGVFGRDLSTNKVFTVLEKIGIDGESDETTGLAFCDNFRRMIVAFQDDGRILEVRRDDGRAWFGSTLNVKHHGLRSGFAGSMDNDSDGN